MPDPALAKFLNAELVRRGWSKKDFARALEPFDISQSAAYLILRGEDNVRRDTSEAIAAALGMTPAELWTAVYRPRDLTAAQIAASTAIERMPAEKRPFAIEMLNGLAVQPTAHTPTQRPEPSAKRRQAAIRKLNGTTRNQPETGPDGTLLTSYEQVGPLDAISRFLGFGRVATAQAT